MCGRYRLSRRKQLIAEYFDTDHEVDWEPRYSELTAGGHTRPNAGNSAPRELRFVA
jgi:putative SOS response-associated peptidase YedK